MLSITNNSIKHQSFLYTQLNDQAVLFLTIQLNLNHLFVLILNIKTFLFDPIKGLPLWVRVNLEVMAMKGLYRFSQNFSTTRALQSDFSVITMTLIDAGRGLTSLQRCSQCILQFQPTGQAQWRDLGKYIIYIYIYIYE